MAMPASATFHYRVQVEEIRHGDPQVWSGRATTLHPPDHQPGLAGSTPAFELSNGIVSVRPARSGGLLRRFFGETAPGRAFSFRIGAVLDELLEPGDEIVLLRDAMAALSLCLVRRSDLLLGLGALTGPRLPGNDDVQIEDDPRTAHSDDYWLAHQIRDQQAHVIWIDPQIETVASSLRRVDGLAEGRPLVVAYRNVEQRVFIEELNRRARRFNSTSFAQNPRFENMEQWRAYLMHLPDTPPTDLQLHARRGTQQVRLAEGQETELGPFIVRAEKVNWAIEWDRSVVALVRQDARADRTALRQASALFVSDPLRIGES